VIADHIRSAAFLIADGVLPSNEGRGYVMRRIIRRALRHGHQLQAHGPFFHEMVGTLVDEMGEAYPLLKKTQPQIEKVLLKEEEQFDVTLDQGMKILSEAIARMEGTEIPGEVVFQLYDTYGFPTDLTADIARERELTLDMEGFDKAMAEQRERARAASKFSVADMGLELDATTEFIGYESLSGTSKVIALFSAEKPVDRVEAGADAIVVLDRTPFYAESGGQVGDTGKLFGNGKTFDVLDTQKTGEAYLHKGKVLEGAIAVGDELEARVDRRLREATRLNHSATHLLHAALKKVLGDHVNQRGSLVEPERLRFDFSHFEPLSRDDLRTIEQLVNEQVRGNSEVRTEVMPIDEARARGAVALFSSWRDDFQELFPTQLVAGDPLSFQILTRNGDRADSRGLEAEFALSLGDGWQLDAALGLLDTEIERFAAAPELEGRELPHAPATTAHLGLGFDPGSRWFARLDVTRRAAFYFDSTHDRRADSVTLVNGRVGYRSGDWTLSLWGRNLGDERYAERGFFFGNEPPDFVPREYLQLSDRRAWGLNLRWSLAP